MPLLLRLPAYFNCWRFCACLLLLSLGSISLQALDDGVLIYEEIDNNTLAVSGCLGAPEHKVIIPQSFNGKTVIRIKAGAFDIDYVPVGNITEVEIPSTITTIDDLAFVWCDQMRKVFFHGNAPEMVEGSFYACENATFYYAEGMSGYEALNALNWYGITFYEWKGYDPVIQWVDEGDHIKITNYLGTALKVEIPNTIEGKPVKIIGTDAFNDCPCEEIILPSSVTTIEASAFSNSSSLHTITLSANLTSIGYGAFQICQELTSISIPEGVETLESDMFRSCTKLASISLPDSLKTIGSSAFYNCQSLEQILLPANLETLWGDCFQSCTSLQSITLPNSIGSIPDYAFNGCTALESIIMGNDIQSIGQRAFYGCESIIQFQLPANLTLIGEQAFGNMPALQNFQIENINAVFKTIDGVLFSKDETTLVKCPQTRSGSYSIPSSVTTISSYAFEDCLALTEIQFPTNLDSIGSFVFSGCSTIATIQLPALLSTIGQNTFDSCTNLTAVTMLGPLQTIPHGTFRDCTKLTTVILPNSVTMISTAAFRTCTNLQQITFPESLDEIESWAFEDCSSLQTINLPNGFTRLESDAFKNCTQLSSVTLPVTIEKMLPGCFENCAELTEITIPASVDYIGTEAFLGCSKLDAIYFRGNAPNTQLSYQIFSGCHSNITAYIRDSSVGFTRPEWESIRTSDWAPQGELLQIFPEAHSIDGENQIYDFFLISNPSWSIVSNPSWITVDPINGPIDTKISVTVTKHIGTTERIGIIDFGNGVTHTLSQGFIPPAWSISATEKQLDSTAQSYEVSVESNTDWAVVNELDWVTVTPTNGTLNGSVEISVSENDTQSERSGIITIAGISHEIYQDGNSPYVAIDPTTKTADQSQQTYTVTVTSNTKWTVLISDPEWISVDQNSGSGNGAILISITSYSGSGSRSGSVTIGSEIHTITQTGTAVSGDFEYEIDTDYYGENFVVITSYTGNDATVVIPDKIAGIPVRELDSWSFCRYGDSLTAGNPNIQSIMIPNSVTVISSIAFLQSTNITQYIVAEDNPTFSSKEGLIYNKAKTSLEFLPPGYAGKLELEEGITRISGMACYRNGNLTEVVLPSTLSTLRGYVFDYCTNLETVYCKAETLGVGSECFGNCPKLTSVYFEGHAPTIASNAFTNHSENLVIYHTSGAIGFDLEPWKSFTLQIFNPNGTPQIVLQLSKSQQVVSPVSPAFDLSIEANTSWTITTDQFWISFSTTSGTGNDSVTVSIELNSTPNDRVALVELSASDSSEKTTCEIIQKGQGFHSSLKSNPDQTCNLCWEASVGGEYQIEWSTDLEHWNNDGTTYTADSENYSVSLGDLAEVSGKFFRLIIISE